MSRRCDICGKGPVTGVMYKRRGLAKAKGGVGRKIVGKTKIWCHPNIQRLKTRDKDGTVRFQWVCTKCIRSDRIQKAPKQKLEAAQRALVKET